MSEQVTHTLCGISQGGDNEMARARTRSSRGSSKPSSAFMDFAEGIDAAAKWHTAEYWRLVASAEIALRHERAIDCAEMLNKAIEHARSVSTIRALASALASASDTTEETR